jgi:C-terminal processing protease CtpA/Prc
VLILVSALGAGEYAFTTRGDTETVSYKTTAEADAYVRFQMEIFDIIVREYWQTTAEGDLADHFALSLGKATGVEKAALPTRDRAGVANMIAAELAKTPEDKKKQLMIDTGIIALANLAPLQRSGLLSQKAEAEFRDNANNIDRSKDLYASLDLEAGAPKEKVEEAYEEKKAVLEAATTPEAEAELKEIAYVHEVLTGEVTKSVYDQTKIEPTVGTRKIGASTMYVNLSQVSPASFSEFLATLQGLEAQSISTLVIDLRGNVGGTFDFAKYLLALFLGPNQYAFDLYRKDTYVVERTPAVAKMPSLDSIEEIAVLTDGMTQSTPEVFAATMKRLNRAKLVGTQTRGWGSVENTYPIETEIAPGEKYLVLLVNSLTLADDNQPIEGRGVAPHVDIGAADWKQKVATSFDSRNLVQAVIQEVTAKNQ